MKRDITVVIATYNGDKYLSQQIDSILSCEGFGDHVKEIIVSDDHSNDNTIKIVNKYISYGNPIRLISNPDKGIITNFFNGISSCTTEFIMLSDQDDVWHKDKIKKMYGIIVKYKGTLSPALVFSDSFITDSNGVITSDSFLNSNKINLEKDMKFNNLLLNNICQGCVTIINRRLFDMAYDFDVNKIIMHDWLFILIAAKFGELHFTEDKLIYYRIHEDNVLGEKKTSLINKLSNFKRLNDRNYNLLVRSIEQSRYFHEKFDIENRDVTFIEIFKSQKTVYKKISFLFLFFKIDSFLKKINNRV